MRTINFPRLEAVQIALLANDKYLRFALINEDAIPLRTSSHLCAYQLRRRLSLNMKACVATTIFISLIAGGIAQECPELPDTGVDFGGAVGPYPEDVPSGCSAFEVLVGTSRWRHLQCTSHADGL
jgi:hypothetical protein